MAMTGVGKSMGPQLMVEIGDLRCFAHQKSLVGFAGGDHFGGGPSEFRVVHGFGGVGADVFQVVAFFE